MCLFLLQHVMQPHVFLIFFHHSWILYEKPDFQGRCVALEEGGIELTNVWAEPGPGTEPQNGPPMLIGSIRLAVWVRAVNKYSSQPSYSTFNILELVFK